jgi:hypothetical protein
MRGSSSSGLMESIARSVSCRTYCRFTSGWRRTSGA